MMFDEGSKGFKPLMNANETLIFVRGGMNLARADDGGASVLASLLNHPLRKYVLGEPDPLPFQSPLLPKLINNRLAAAIDSVH